MESMIERVARAMEDASFGYSMNLIRLVDGVSTYHLKYSDGESLEFDGTDELYMHVAEKKRHTLARAAIEAMREPTAEMRDAMNEDIDYDVDVVRAYTAAIDAALSGPKDS